jgi:hypothetical protein
MVTLTADLISPSIVASVGALIGGALVGISIGVLVDNTSMGCSNNYFASLLQRSAVVEKL